MAKLKWKLPPLYIPSSGSMVRVKFRISSGLGKDVFIVRPRVPSSSARSDIVVRISQGISQRELEEYVWAIPFCTRS